MKSLAKFAALIAIAVSISACTRIETGEVGLRTDFFKQVQSEELMPGSLNQTIVGSVTTFPTKDVAIKVDDMTPLAKDNSTMKDFDVTVIYGINPKSVSDLWVNKNRSFHARSATDSKDILLMYNYLSQTARNATYKASRDYEALDMNDHRASMETKIRELMVATLAAEKLDTALTIHQVQIRAITPADSVVASANELVRSKNELKQKEVEVKTAEAEARRMAALANQNSNAIAYMRAQAELNISEGIKNGKVQTIVVPSNMTALGTIGGSR